PFVYSQRRRFVNENANVTGSVAALGTSVCWEFFLAEDPSNQSVFLKPQTKIFVLWCSGTPLKRSGPTLCYNTTSALNLQPSKERLTIMTTHGSATALESPHETETTQITISDALRRRAQAVISDTSIDPQWRTIIRYALEIN